MLVTISSLSSRHYNPHGHSMFSDCDSTSPWTRTPTGRVKPLGLTDR